jgi:hypothetical protein
MSCRVPSLLSLFGQQFTQQFMSESINELDHIVFAMGPLGILTAIVGAIRVGGHPWLKALVGRARENISSAEVELMSSTSHEVRELWDGKAVVRTQAQQMVTQLVFLKHRKHEATFGLTTLEAEAAKGEAEKEMECIGM